MRPVNLIPPEDRRGERAPLRSGPLAYVLVAVLLLAFVGVYMLVTTGNSISENEAAVASLEQELESSEARAQALSSFSEFAVLEQSRTQTVTSLAQSRFDWERVMRELALVIPDEISLKTVVGSISGDATGGGDSEGAQSPIEAPTLKLTGCAAEQAVVAAMLSALRDIDGVTRVGLTSSSDSESEISGGSSDAECAAPTPFAVDVTVAFDEVAVDPATGGIVPPEGSVPVPGDGSGVAEAIDEKQQGQDAVDSAQEKSRKAVDTLIPGT